jgi:hypothetical protein
MGSDHRATGPPEASSRPRVTRQLLNAAVPGDVPPPLGVSGTGPVLAALPLPWYREPVSGCPAGPRPWDRAAVATGSPEGRARAPCCPPAAEPPCTWCRSGLFAATPVSGVPTDTLLTKLTEGAFVSSVSR